MSWRSSDTERPLNVYNSRPDADGTIFSVSGSRHLVALVLLLITINMVGWGTYGAVELVCKIGGLL